MSLLRVVFLLAFCVLLVPLPTVAQHPGSGLGGMFDPDLMDPPDKPFSYFACPTDMLSVIAPRRASR